MIFKKHDFDKRFPSVRQVLPNDTPSKVLGAATAPKDVGALFVPLCGYQEVQARRLRAAAHLCTRWHRRHGGTVPFPLLVSGTNIEMKRAVATWDELRQGKPWLPPLITDGGYAKDTHGNGNALHGMLRMHAPVGKPVAIVTGKWHMNRVLARVMNDIHDYVFVPFRVSHTRAERAAGLAMGFYELTALNKVFPKREIRLGDMLRAMRARSGEPLRPVRPVISRPDVPSRTQPAPSA